MGAEDVVEIDGCLLSNRTWLVITDAWRATGLGDRPRLAQGSWHQGILSSGTHSGGGAADIRVINLPASKREPFVVHLRERNACAWLRDEAHGWMTGDHIHLIVRDEPGLSTGARSQVREYDRGGDGLTGTKPDYHPRPTQYPIEHFTEADMPLTDAEKQEIIDGVWAKVLKRPWDGKAATAEAMLGSTHFYAIQAGLDGDTPATATTSPGKPTIAKQILARLGLGGGGSLSDADVARIATKTADLLAARLKA